MSGTEEHWGPVATWARYATEAEEGSGIQNGIIAMSVGTLAGLGGIGLAYQWYYVGDGSTPAGIMATWPRLHAFLMDKWRVDELYEMVFLGPFKWIAVVTANIDRILVDGLLTVVPGWIAKGLGMIATRLQTGAIYMYTTLFVIGAAAVVWWFTYPHTTVVGEVDGATVAWTAERGTGYTYRWDFDSDGVLDTESSESPAASHEYGASDGYVALVAQLEDHDGNTLEELEITPGAQELPLAGYVGELAQVQLRHGAADGEPVPEHPPDPVLPPRIRLVESHVVIDTGSADAQIGGERPHEADGALVHEFPLDAGDVARFSTVTVRIAARACATVETTSVFGNHGHTRECVTVRIPRTEMEPMASAHQTGGSR
jgi:hypothetical protein